MKYVETNKSCKSFSDTFAIENLNLSIEKDRETIKIVKCRVVYENIINVKIIVQQY